jgi:glycosyltransferase involved in cell wall biosynthesis
VIEAFAQLPERLRDGYRLAVVGPRGWDYEETVARAQARGEEVTLLGQVPDEDLAALYRLCTVFCFPSLYEGFGLPLLEGMAAGAACITSSVSSLPEVGGDAVRYVDPHSVDAIAAALAELLESEPERRRLGEQARERARSFSWARTAEELVRELAGLGESAGKR